MSRRDQVTSAAHKTLTTEGLDLTRHLAGQSELLTPAALEFLVDLHRRFEPARQARLTARRERLDPVTQAIQGAQSSTVTLKGSTEEEQFQAVAA